MAIKRKGLTAVILGAGLAVSTSGVLAQQDRPGWYVGGSLGQSDISDINCPTGFSCDDKDTAWKIFGGYEINRNFAAEIGYSDLGEFNRSSALTNRSVEATAWELTGVGMFPLNNQFSLYGKLGLYYSETEVSGVGDDTNTDLTFGAGAQYNFSPTLGLRAEWQRYNDVSSPIGGSDIDVWSLGLRVKF